MLNGLHLFAGYGGADEALAGYVNPIAYCEIDEGAQRILLHRMRKGEISAAPIWDNVLTLQRNHIEGRINIITAGWPCKQISVAGNREGIEGPDSKLFFEVARLARELEPEFLFLENSPNIYGRDMGFDRVLSELAAQGFYVEWGVLSAFDVGAPHYRDRAWILASHPDRLAIRIEQIRECGGSGEAIVKFISERMGNAHAHSERLERRVDTWKAWKAFALSGSGSGRSWPSGIPEPTIRGLDDGPGSRRIRSHRKIGVTAGGNGWVPQTAREAFERLIGIK